MGVNLGYVFRFGAGFREKVVLDAEADRPGDMEAVLSHKVVNGVDGAHGAVFNREHAEVAKSPLDGAEDGVPILKIEDVGYREHFIGGNLSVIAAMCGTPYELKGENSVLFLEDVGEEAYAIDRMLQQLWQNGLLKEVKGIVFGQFTHCTPTKQSKYEFTVKEILTQYANLAKVPTIYGFPAGHEKTNAFLPLGVNVKVNVADSRVEFFISEAHCKIR